MIRRGTRGSRGLAVLLLAGGWLGPVVSPVNAAGQAEAVSRFVGLYCVACHNRDERVPDLDLDALVAEGVERNAQVWEKVVRRLAARQMPPEGEVKPTGREYDAFVAAVAGALDRL